MQTIHEARDIGASGGLNTRGGNVCSDLEKKCAKIFIKTEKVIFLIFFSPNNVTKYQILLKRKLLCPTKDVEHICLLPFFALCRKFDKVKDTKMLCPTEGCGAHMPPPPPFREVGPPSSTCGCGPVSRRTPAGSRFQGRPWDGALPCKRRR